MSRWIWIVVWVLAFAGCISVDCGYTPNEDVVSRGAVALDERFPVTFSLSVECPVSEPIPFYPKQEALRSRVQAALEATQLFSSVRYEPSAPKDAYHIVFTFHVGGSTASSNATAGLIAGSSLFIIPVWEWATFDGSAEVFLRGDVLHARGAAEKMCVPMWLPLSPIGLFWNCAVGWNSVERGVVNALVNDVSAFHQARFLRN